MTKVVGVDVGGTFTDLFLYDSERREFAVAKVSSNRGDEAAGFIKGLERLSSVGALQAIVHGTTAGTNALLERKGARVGLMATKGFRDVIEMRRRDRPMTWGLKGDFRPVVDRDLRLEIDERVLADGSLLVPLSERDVEAAARQLIERGAQAVAVCFINSYASAENEAAAARIVRRLWPNEHVSVSSEILPEIREFERTSTTALNAYLQPIVGSYLAKLEAALKEKAFRGSFHIVQSNGGVMSTAAARRFPVRTAMSGPAAGVIAAGAIAARSGYPNVITADLGGTSFDVSLIADGKAALSPQTTVDFGLVIRTPMIEITSIGAGGGSIAHVDKGGLLEVGPESAGSRPGPACYGKGNTRPTLTDANLVLGRINGERPIGGELARLDAEAAHNAVVEHVGRPLGLDAVAAAEAIVRVADAKMAGAIRLVSIERGYDPGRFMALPFGGGGALHVGAMIRGVGLKGAIVPRYPGVTSALGCVIADIRHDQVRTLNFDLDTLDAARLDRFLVSEGAAARAVVEAAGLPVEGIDVTFELDMHYLGQTHTVGAALPVGYRPEGTGIDAAIVRAAFEAAYRRSFSRLLPGLAVRIVTLRTAAVGRRPAFDLKALAPKRGRFEDAVTGRRAVHLAGQWVDTPVYARLELPVGAVIAGPAVLEQADATTLLEPGMGARVDDFGNLIIERSGT